MRIVTVIPRVAARLAAWCVCALPVLIIAGAVVPGESLAQKAAKPVIALNTPIAIEVDKAQLVQLPGPAKTVFVANPDIADVQVPTPGTFLVYGKKAGSTSVFAISESGASTSYTVRVSRAIGDIAAAMHSAVPGGHFTVSTAPDGIAITGSVNSPRDAERVKAAAKEFLGDKETIDFELTVAAPTQVTLRVQIAEVSRTVSRSLGVNWSALGTIGSIAHLPALTLNANTDPIICVGTAGTICPSANFNGVINALDSQGLATILAEPTLTAISGETANFLVGGQYPIPVPQGVQIVTIEYKSYGISLDFTPTVLDGNRINVKVRPEVSQLTSVGAATLDGVTVPALTVSRADTTVELGSGESFAIAGLFQNNGQNQIQSIPWLSDVPILGTLFRSSTFQRNESELVIIVTPYIVRPVSRPADLLLPNRGLHYSSDIERILLNRLTAQSPKVSAGPVSPTTEPRLHGPAGFMLE
jgi:pilus assembly protein CpaC